MRSKFFGLALSAVLFALCAPIEAQQPAAKVPRIGFLDSGSASDPRTILAVEALRQGLRELGYVEGKNINIDYRYDEGKPGGYKSWPRIWFISKSISSWGWTLRSSSGQESNDIHPVSSLLPAVVL